MFGPSVEKGNKKIRKNRRECGGIKSAGAAAYAVSAILVNPALVLLLEFLTGFFGFDKTRTVNVLNYFKNDRSSKFISEVIFKKYVVS
jgi:hypothetical protein